LLKERAPKLADQGDVSLAIDLYRGKVATTPDMAHEIMRGVPEGRANAIFTPPWSSSSRSPT
jgi:carboxymethylenebutenolidase